MIKHISNSEDWNNNFVLCANSHTFLQSWEWGQVQKATGEDVRYLGFFDGDTQIGAALVITVNARRGRHYLVPHGPLAAPAQSAAVLKELVQYLSSTAQPENVVALRVAPLLTTNPENTQLFAAAGFRPAPIHVHAELTWVLDIDASEEDLLQGMRKTTRHAIRKADKAGVTTEIVGDTDQALGRFWPLYEQTRQRHGFVLWPHSMLKAQLDIFAQANHIYTVIARHNNQDVAAAILIHFGSTVFYYHGASTKLPSAIPAAQALQWAAIREAKRRGATHYNFWGIAPDNQPNHPFAGITTFKKGFGGYAIDYLHAQDLPLAAGYWKLWAVDTYRKWRRGF